MHSLAPPSGAAIDDSITTEPPCPPFLVDMRRTQARKQMSAPKVSTSSTSRMVSVSASSSREFLPMMPALCTKCVMGPSAFAASSKVRSISASSAMSPLIATALRPAALTASTTSFAALALLL